MNQQDLITDDRNLLDKAQDWTDAHPALTLIIAVALGVAARLWGTM